MPRYLVERTLPGPELHGAAADDADAQQGVTWLHAYITLDRQRSYDICDSPSPEAIRLASRANGMPIDRITELCPLDPHAPH